MYCVCFYQHSNESDDNEKSSLRVGTADILTMLTANEPEVDFTLALGADTFIDLANGKWRRTEEVFKLVGHRVIVFRRLSENNNGPEKEEQIQRGIAKWQLLNETMSSIRLVGISSLTDASSSIARSTIDETILSKLVTKPILEYIKQNKLYAFS